MEKKKVKFEEKLEELETIVKSLENGDIELDQAINKFTKAMNLIKECDSDLKRAESSLTSIVKEDGTVKEFKEEMDEKY